MKRWLSVGYLPLRSTIFPLTGLLVLLGLAEGTALWLLRGERAPLEALFSLPGTVLYFAALLFTGVLLAVRCSGGAYTLGRLNVSPMALFLLWGGWGALCFFLVMVWQAALFFLLGTVYTRLVPWAVHDQTLLLTVYRSPLLYTLLPLWAPLRILGSLLACVSLGFSTALWALSRGKRPWLLPFLALAAVRVAGPGGDLPILFGCFHLFLAAYCVDRWRRACYEKD